MLNVDSVAGAAREMRIDIIKAISAAGSGHPGGSLSAADIIATLYFYKMKIDPKNPKYLKVVWGVGYKMEKQ